MIEEKPAAVKAHDDSIGYGRNQEFAVIEAISLEGIIGK